MKEELVAQGKADLQALMDAEDIKADKKKMKQVLKQAKMKMASIQSIQDLKDAYNAKYGEGRIMKEKAMAKEEAAHEAKETPMQEKKEDADEKA